MADGTNREEQAAADFAQRWIAAVQAMGNQILRQQETFQQMMQESMRSYVQLLNTLHLPMAEQPQEGQQAFQQASEQWMQLAQQQQAFQQLVQQSLAAYMEHLRPSR